MHGRVDAGLSYLPGTAFDRYPPTGKPLLQHNGAGHYSCDQPEEAARWRVPVRERIKTFPEGTTEEFPACREYRTDRGNLSGLKKAGTYVQTDIDLIHPCRSTPD